MSRLEKYLKDYKGINCKIRDRYDLSISDLETISNKASKKAGNNINDLIFYVISFSFKMGFVAGRKSIK
ncbi:hypothetical protein [Anaerococcus prevotii]|uniref:Uncharacterized protein n=1 Tax=Anaerococcus prevotii ACS-065-V-Col13 TaxID=879305 RepID=F0GU40_9FIRM|nr:hypothetical protein [Anaerococcus prevotii]EGC82323.1 hypothetical protein HMPREF9290_1259 [Anaerococcus prevotii ACS-065-V-Col13]